MLASGGDSSLALTGDEENQLKNLEKEMQMHTVMALRGRAEEILIEERREAEQKKAAKPGLFARLFRGWLPGKDGKKEVEVAGVTLSMSEQDLCEFVGAENEDTFNDFEQDDPESMRYSVSVAVDSLVLSLSDREATTGEKLATHELVRFAFGPMACNVAGRRGPVLALAVDFSLESVDLRDMVTPNSIYQTVLKGGSKEKPLFCIHGEDGPADGHSSYVLVASTAPSTIIYSQPLGARLGRFMGFWRQVDSVALTSLISRSAASTMDQHRVASQQQFRRVIDNREPVDVQLDLHLPDVIFPSAFGGAKEDSVVVVRLGDISAKSTVSGMPVAAPGAVDSCEVLWDGLKVLACGAKDDWMTKGESVFAMSRMSTVVDVATERKNTGVRQLRVSQHIKDIQVSASSESLYHSTAALLSFGEEQSSEKEVALDSSHLSSVVKVAISFALTLEQGWEYMKHREIGMLRSLHGEQAARLRAYADWTRLHYTVAIDSVSLLLSDVDNGAVRPVVRTCVRGMEADVTVRSLDAEANSKIVSIEMEDLVQTFGDEYKFLVRACGNSDGEAFMSGRIHAWHRTSPDYAGVDADASTTLGHFSLGSNLETLAVVQNLLVDSIERAVKQRAALFNQKQEDADKERRQVMIQNVHAAANALKTVKARPVSVVFKAVAHKFDANLYTQRGGKLYHVASVAVHDCQMTNKTSRKGRIEIMGSMGSLSLKDLTPPGEKYKDALHKSDAAQDLIKFEYVHYGKNEGPNGIDASLNACIAKMDGIVSPRFIAEIYFYVSESSIYRTNVMAVRNATRQAAKFRQRLDTETLSLRYAIDLKLSVGGFFFKVPAGIAEDDMFLVSIPPVEASNAFDFTTNSQCPVERMVTVINDATIATVIGGTEQKLLSASMQIEMHRQLAVADLGPDVPVLKISWSVGTLAVSMAQPQVTLAWRTVMNNIREAKATMSWAGERKARAKDRSILDIEVINRGLQTVLQEAALAEEQRQASKPRSDQQLLDFLFQASLEKVQCTLLGAEGSPMAVICVNNVSAGLWIRSDTSYCTELRVFAITFDDADAASQNKHRALIRPTDPDAELASFEYRESKEGDGKAKINFTGVKVVLSSDPIFAIASNVLDAFSAVASGGEDTRLGDTANTGLFEASPDAYSWWGDNTVEAHMTLGHCDLTFLQDCMVEDTPRVTLVFFASAEYAAAKFEESLDLTIHDVEFFATLPEFPDPLHMLDRSSCSMHVDNEYKDGLCISDVTLFCRSLDFVVTYQDVKLVYAIVRACQRSGDRSGMMNTSGVKQIEEFLMAEEQLAEKRMNVPLRDSGTPTAISKMHVQCEILTVCLINDCMGWTVPFATASAKGLCLESETRNDQSSTLNASVTLDANFYNIINTCFEPILEPWMVKLDVVEEPGRRACHTKVHSPARLDLNVSEMHMRGLVQTMESWMQDSKTWGTELNKDGTKFWPYRLRNEAGAPLTFWLGSSLDPPEAQGSEQAFVKELASGGEEPFLFSHKRALQARQRDMSLEFHTLSIKFEGVPDVLTHVPVDITGVHMLPLGELRAVAEIHSDSGTKIVAIQSTFKVYNKTSLPVETAIFRDADSEVSPDCVCACMHEYALVLTSILLFVHFVSERERVYG